MRAHQVVPAGSWTPDEERGRVLIDFDRRHRRRIVLLTDAGDEVLVDLPQAAFEAAIDVRYDLQKSLSAVHDIRHLRKHHMVHNDYLPQMEIDPETYEVRADGMLLTCEAASVLPMAQRYFLF